EPHHPPGGRGRGRVTPSGFPAAWSPPPLFGSRRRQNVVLVAALAYCVWAIAGLHIDGSRALAGFGRAWDLLVRMVPPDFGRHQLLLKGLVESLQMAFAATLVGLVLSIPLGIAAATNLAPRP